MKRYFPLIILIVAISCTTSPQLKKTKNVKYTYNIQLGGYSDYNTAENVKKSIIKKIKSLIYSGVEYADNGAGGSDILFSDATTDQSINEMIIEQNIRTSGQFIIIKEKGFFQTAPKNDNAKKIKVTVKESFDILNDLLQKALSDEVSTGSSGEVYLSGDIDINMYTGKGSAIVSVIPD